MPERSPVPAAGTTTLAKVQGWLHMIGAILFPAGVAVVLLKGPSFEAAPIAGSLIVVAAMALFVVIVFQTSRARVNHRTVLSSAAAEAVLAVAVLPRGAVPARAGAGSR